MRLMGSSPFTSTGYVLELDGYAQHAHLAVKTDPSADRAVLELQATDRPGKPERRLHGKQPPEPSLPQLPRPLQHDDAALLDQLEPLQDEAPVLGEKIIEFNPDVGDYEPASPFPNDEDEPALHLLRAGGAWPRPKIQKIVTSERAQTGGRSEGMRRSSWIPGRALCPMDLAWRLKGTAQQQEHWMLESIW